MKTSLSKELLRPIAVLVTVLALSACAQLSATQSAASVAQIQSGTWVVQLMNNQATSTPKPTLNFGKNRQLTGNASCNSYFMAYQVQHQKLQIKPGGSTMKACLSETTMKQEQTFLKQLELVDTWRIDESGKLLLTGKGVSISATRHE